MRKGLLAVIVFLFWASNASALLVSNDDLWDVSQGSVVDDTSGAMNYSSSYYSNVNNMFGNDDPNSTERYNTVFRDYEVLMFRTPESA